jgi:hypothetical protein
VTATVTALRPRLDSRLQAQSGGHVSQVLDVIETLLRAAEHPDITAVERYGPGLGPWGPSVSQSKVKAISGVTVRHQSTATASIWEAVWPGEEPADPPAVLPPPRQNRAPRLAVFVAQLLDAAQPAQFQAWRLVTLPDLGSAGQAGLPFGVSVVEAGGKRTLLRVTATGPMVGADPLEEPFPDYVIPEGVKTCLGSGTAKTSLCPPVVAVSAGRS